MKNDLKEILRQRKKRYRDTNKDKIKLAARKYYLANRDKILKKYNQMDKQKIKEYRKNNQDKINLQRREHYDINKERLREEGRNYYHKNRDKIIRRITLLNEVNPEKKKQYYNDNKEKINKTKRDYYQKNKEKITKLRKVYNKVNEERIKKYRIQYQKENKEKIIQTRKKYYEKNKEKMLAKGEKYRKDNKDVIKQKHKKYYEDNKEVLKQKLKQYYKDNPKYARNYYDANKDKIKSKIKEYMKKRYNEDNNFRISMLLRTRIGIALKRYTKTGKVMSSKKYQINFERIINHLKPFPKNMKLYHIDHIRPLCSFNFVKEDGSTNLEEVKKAFAPENHQWLLAKDNQSKGRKWITQSVLNKYH